MSFIQYVIQTITKLTSNTPYKGNEVTFQDIVNKLNEPPVVKVKTEKEIERDYLIQEAMSKLEVDMLTMGPAELYQGVQRWKDRDENIYIDWVPCMVRPEVLYCNTHRS